jgi:hypothetical protein
VDGWTVWMEAQNPLCRIDVAIQRGKSEVD